jgi:hypothetical protein
MAASSSSDIPESKSDYCPCNRCGVARKEGNKEMREAIQRVRELAKKFESESAGEMVSYNLIADRIYTALKQGSK